MAGTFLIYGANGYTGELITRFAVERGMKPVLAGRNAIQIEALAKKHHLEYRVFSLEETGRLDAALQEVRYGYALGRPILTYVKADGRGLPSE